MSHCSYRSPAALHTIYYLEVMQKSRAGHLARWPHPGRPQQRHERLEGQADWVVVEEVLDALLGAVQLLSWVLAREEKLGAYPLNRVRFARRHPGCRVPRAAGHRAVLVAGQRDSAIALAGHELHVGDHDRSPIRRRLRHVVNKLRRPQHAREQRGHRDSHPVQEEQGVCTRSEVLQLVYRGREDPEVCCREAY